MIINATSLGLSKEDNIELNFKNINNYFCWKHFPRHNIILTKL